MRTPAAKPSRFPWIAAAACAVAGVGLFQFAGSAAQGYVKSDSLFWWWVSQWLDPQAETEHGWLILGISGWLLWRNLRRRGAPPDLPGGPESLVPALAAMAGGLALHALGFIAQQGRISIVAWLVYLWGVVRLAGGRRWGAAAVFPLGFLLFAIPINVIDEVGLPLRIGVTTAGQAIAHAVGIEVLRSGTQLLSPDGQFNYDVAAPCSGVRSLVALAALALLMGYLEFRSCWRRGLVLLLSFPLVFVGNVARIVAIIVAAQAGGAVWGDRAHEVMGYGVFVIVLGGVLGAASLLRRFFPEPPVASAAPPAKRHLLSDILAGRRAVVAVGVVVGLAGGELVWLRRVARTPMQGEAGVILAADGQNPVELPAFIGTEWIGRRTEVTAIERQILPPDTGFARKQYVAVADRSQQVLLSIVLSGRDRTSIHRPELCLVGQGWTIAQTVRHRFSWPGSDRGDFPATLLRVRREVQTPKGKVVVPQLVAYWFSDGDGIVATHLDRFRRDAWNRVVHRRADRWAYVLLQTDAADGEEAALRRMQAVLQATLPVFQPAPRR